MPQPLSRVRPKARVIVGPSEQTFNRRPQFAGYISEIAVQWAYNEANLCSILAYLLSAEARPVMAMIQKLRSARTQFELIEAAAGSKLVDPELETLQAVMLMAQSGAEKRNMFLHNVWGFCDEMDDAIILVEQRAYLDIFVRVQETTMTR